MAEGTEKARQESFLTGEESGPDIQPSKGPVASPPAPSSFPASRKAGPAGTQPSQAAGQLSLPLGEEEEQHREAAPARKRTRKPRGFTPVMSDPEVARSYSQNAALDQAVAQGLAQLLTRLSPQELAELRARVARAASRNGKGSSPRPA